MGVHAILVCSTFAVMQRVARVCQRQLILVINVMYSNQWRIQQPGGGAFGDALPPQLNSTQLYCNILAAEQLNC